MPSAARALVVDAPVWDPLSETGIDSSSGDAARWRSVAARAVYFGHQSVGDDIAVGIDRLNAELSLGLRLVETHAPAAVAHPAFVHFHAGGNNDPASKNAAMLRILHARPRADRGIVLLKYCYVDIGRDTDVAAVFNAYRATVRAIRSCYPDVTIVHTTVPVTTVESAFKAAVKRLIGRRSVRQDAVARHRYNALVRADFAERELLFDIARIETTRADGSRVQFAWKGERIDSLAPEYTRDGGHLNARGQALVAKELLNVLAAAAETDR
jgi:hypothetical protein